LREDHFLLRNVRPMRGKHMISNKVILQMSEFNTARSDRVDVHYSIVQYHHKQNTISSEKHIGLDL
jgi:hypothetical protein